MSELVLKNIRLVYKIASKYPKDCRVSMEDRVQEGCIGLIKAASRYDPDKGIPFGAFAGMYIDWAISYAVRNTNPVKVSTDVTQYISHIMKHELQELTFEEHMSRTKETRTVVKQALSFMNAEFDSLDFEMTLRNGGEMEHQETIGVDDQYDIYLLLRQCREIIPPDVFHMFELVNAGYTFAEVGEMYGRNDRSVQHLFRKARRKLKEHNLELTNV